MALGFTIGSGGGGSFLPIVKYDARAGRMFRMDREDGSTEPVDITKTFKAVFDIENIEVGWIMFSAGGPPDFKMAKLGTPPGPRPSENHKQGVRLVIKLSKENGGDVREIAGTSAAFLRGIDGLHDAYLAGVATHPNLLPVVVLKDTLPIESGSGAKKSTNYQPVFEIATWVARPSDLVYQPREVTPVGPQSGTNTLTMRPPATGSTIVPPPNTTTIAPAGADDFG